MKILIINQHTGNRGDEAAGRALIKGIEEKIDFNKNKLSIIYNKNTISDIDKIDQRREIYHYPGTKFNFIDKIIAMLTFVLPISLIKYLFVCSKTISREYGLIKESDKIISAPGGVNLGPYKDWRYLWRLYVAIKLKKSIAIYSISLGPLPDNILFRKSSLYVLKKVAFLSIRDKKSQKIADDMNINYIPSIDTAFIGFKKPEFLPNDIENLITEDYAVIVPNELYNWGNRNEWHHAFLGFNKNDLDKIYIQCINSMLKKNMKVVLLPQLYGTQDDISYFKRLKGYINDINIHIVDTKHNSDVQQVIVSKAKFVIGARYHSIIFAINNQVPFLSLSYEHKMKNTLEILGLENYNLDLTHLLSNKNIGLSEKIEELVLESRELYDGTYSKIANKIAVDTMKKLHSFMERD